MNEERKQQLKEILKNMILEEVRRRRQEIVPDEQDMIEAVREDCTNLIEHLDIIDYRGEYVGRKIFIEDAEQSMYWVDEEGRIFACRWHHNHAGEVLMSTITNDGFRDIFNELYSYIGEHREA